MIQHEANIKHTTGPKYMATCGCGWAVEYGNMNQARKQAERHEAEGTIQNVVDALCKQHGLRSVVVKVSGTMQKTLGQALLSRRVLRISEAMLGHEGLEDTIRHEVAHFKAYDLDGDRGHGASWIARACELGARPHAIASHESPNRNVVYKCAEGCEYRGFKVRPAFESGQRICSRHHLKIERVS